MEDSANFGELKSKAHQWTYTEEEILLTKLKSFTSTYEKKCSLLSSNLSNFSKNLELTNIDYYNTVHSLTTISLQRFVEHVIDKNDIRPVQDQDTQVLIKELTIEERQVALLAKSQQTIQNSLAVLPNRGLKNEDSQSVFEDNVSVASSKILVGQIERLFRNMKLPYIIGSKDFNAFPNVGLIQEEEFKASGEDTHIRDPSGESLKENQEVIMSNIDSSSDRNRGSNINSNIPVSPQMNIVVNKGPNIPQPPSLDNINKINSNSSNSQPIQNPVNPNQSNILKSKNKNVNSIGNEIKDNQSIIEEDNKKSMQDLLRDQMLAKSKSKQEQRAIDANPPLTNNNNPTSQLKPSKTFNLNQASNTIIDPQPKGGINLNQFIKKDLFAAEEEEEDNEDDLPTNVLLRHSGTMQDPNRFAMHNQIIPKVKEEVKEEKTISSGNIFSMKNDNDDNGSGNVMKMNQSNKMKSLLETKKTMMKIFEDDDEDEEKNNQSTGDKVNSITEKTKDLAMKLNQITKKSNKQPKVEQEQPVVVEKKEDIIPIKEEVKQSDEKEEKVKKTKPVKPQLLKKAPTFFEDEEEDNKETIKTEPQKKEMPMPKPIIEKPKEQLPKPKISLFSQDTPIPTQINSENKPKPIIPPVDNSKIDIKQNPTNEAKPITNKPQIPLAQSPFAPPSNIIKLNTDTNTNAEEEIDELSQNRRQSIQDRIKNINKGQDKKKESIDHQPQVFKIDYSSRKTEIENMFAGRMTSSANPFVADNTQIRKATEDEALIDSIGNNNDNNQKEEDNGNNDNKANDNGDDANKEQEKEKEKETIVVVQKKKPKKKAFGGFNKEDESIQKNNEPLRNTMPLKTSNMNKPIQTESKPTEESKPIEEPKPKIGLFTNEQPQKEVKVEKKTLSNIFDLEDTSQTQSNPLRQEKPKALLRTSATMMESSSKSKAANKLKFIFDDDDE